MTELCGLAFAISLDRQARSRVPREALRRSCARSVVFACFIAAGQKRATTPLVHACDKQCDDHEQVGMAAMQGTGECDAIVI